jgi:transcriptional regulator with GAF, ATPase, and Fis domain
LPNRSPSSAISTLFADLSRLLKRLVPFDFISLTLIDPKERVVRLHILETEQPVRGTPPKSTPFEQTPTMAALESRRPYYIPDTAAEDRFPIVLDLLRANGIQSACILPLFTAQRELGGLHFGSLDSEEDIEFMGQVARQVAVAVDNALHSEAAVAYEAQLAHERDRLRTLLEVNNAVAGCLETRELFQAISGSLRRTFGLDYASLLERAVILSTSSTLQVPVRELKRGPAGASVVTLEAAEREAIQRALDDAGGKVGGDSGAAAKLGMKRTTLQAKMRKLGVDTSRSEPRP